MPSDRSSLRIILTLHSAARNVVDPPDHAGRATHAPPIEPVQGNRPLHELSHGLIECLVPMAASVPVIFVSVALAVWKNRTFVLARHPQVNGTCLKSVERGTKRPHKQPLIGATSSHGNNFCCWLECEHAVCMLDSSVGFSHQQFDLVTQ